MMQSQMLAEQVQFMEDRVSALVENRVGTLLTDSENRMQALLSQVVQHVMVLNNPQPQMNGAVTPESADSEMVAAFSTADAAMNDEFKIPGSAKVKPGVKQMISQAWEQHRRDQLAVFKQIGIGSWMCST